MLYGFLIVIHILVSILLVVSILMQRAKGGGLAGIAGGAASQAVFGGRGAATLLHKVTVVLAIVFGVNSLLVGIVSKGGSRSVSVTQETMQEESPLDFLNEDAPAEATFPAGTGGEPTAGVESTPAMEGSGEDAPVMEMQQGDLKIKMTPKNEAAKKIAREQAAKKAAEKNQQSGGE